MEAKEIRSQLAELGVHVGATANESAIVDCHRVGNHPVMYLFDTVGFAPTGEPQRFEGDFGMIAMKVGVALRAREEAKLVMLCDLYAVENEPPIGVKWTHENRVNGAILGAMSCLVMLVRDAGLRHLLDQQPDRLVVAAIENGKIVVQEGQGKKMMKFLRDKMGN